MAGDLKLKFAIDRGGTFTDVFCEVIRGDDVHYRTNKLLSVDPSSYKDAPTEGIRRILEEETGISHPRGQLVDTSRILSIRMGTTVATNALLERQGERTALVVTQGFSDLLLIGNQTRPRIFDLDIHRPDLLYEQVVEVPEDVIIPISGTKNVRNGRSPPLESSELEGRMYVSQTGEQLCIRTPVDTGVLRKSLEEVRASGIDSIAVVLKHAALFPEHEVAVGAIAQEMGFAHVSLSHKVMPMVKMVARGFTAAADAYLTPHIMKYLQTFRSGFDEGLGDVELAFMQSDGGLSPANAFSGHKAILSGPAAGYVGYAATTKWGGIAGGEQLQIIGFDMGGTSTDVSRYDGSMEHVLESTTAGVTIQAPQLDINTVAAGGGSRLFYDNDIFAVGPESAGAHPGPVCYRKPGGKLAVTDANAALGRIVPDFFPKIFGPNEDEALDVAGAKKAMQEVTEQVNANAAATGQPPKTMVEVALGFIDVANEAMCRPIRALTQARGLDVTQHVLACFGGAGGQHACAIARQLGMATVFVHRYASILSAVGMGLASLVQEAQEPEACELEAATQGQLQQKLDKLQEAATAPLLQRGFTREHVHVDRYLNLRFKGTDVALMVSADDMAAYERAFLRMYKLEFGFILQDRPIVVDDCRVRASAAGSVLPDADPPEQPGPLPEPRKQVVGFHSGGEQLTPVYELDALEAGHSVPGPALLINRISTLVIEPQCTAHVTAAGDIRIDVQAAATGAAADSERADPIQLAIFSHRFMSIAEQMGRALQRSSISVNIKERLDFSCALFGPDGTLVANAPHLPVHLGAMSEAVRAQIRYYTEGPGKAVGLQEGDTVVTNHPVAAGGSHLPDITVITPVWEVGRIVFFVASRGHHADVGGISPGSMPPHSKSLAEEGATIISFKLVRDGVFQEEGVTELLEAPAHSGVPGVVGTRCLSDNLSDLKAQVAANSKGISLVATLISEYSLPVVQAYMTHIQANAEASVRKMLVDFSLSQGLPEVGTVWSSDFMDDGTEIRLAVTIDRRNGSAVFDFAGTGPQVLGNTNAPRAVTHSATIYALRCLVRRDIPLNGGCLAPVTIKLPANSLLSPADDAAVVGGNVLTSQRVTDVILTAFKAMACSYGCMNNFTFGDEGMGYYETIAGGGGAGPGYDGCDGVQMHMTNTRITDPEVLERYYPVSLRRFTLRKGSGGAGKWRGGHGVVRELEFLRNLEVGVLTERRALAPRGIEGGQDGLRGVNLWMKANGKTISLGGKASVTVGAGDRIRLSTPGGGGYGEEGADDNVGGAPELSTHDTVPMLHTGSVAAWNAQAEAA